jgi:c-di-GMP-binding flagellar brake protein YcgR
MQEKRRFARVGLDGGASIQFDGHSRDVELVDLSLKGAMVEADRILPLQSGSDCVLTLSLDDTDVSIPIDARVTHHQGQRLGIEFVRVDVADMQHIRRLLELNAGDRDISVENLVVGSDSHSGD